MPIPLYFSFHVCFAHHGLPSQRLASSASLHETMLQVHRGQQEYDRPNGATIESQSYPYSHARINSQAHQNAYSPPPQSVTFSPLQDQALPHPSPSFSPPNVTLPAIRGSSGIQSQSLKHPHPQAAANLPSSSSHHHALNGHAHEGHDHSHRESPRKRTRSSRSPRPSLSRRQSQQSATYVLNPVPIVNGHNSHHHHHSHRVDGSPNTRPVHLQNDYSHQAYRDEARPSHSPYMSDRHSVSSSSSHSQSQPHPQRAMAIDAILSSSRSGPAASAAAENGAGVLSEERERERERETENMDHSESWPPRTSSERSSSTRGRDNSGDNTAGPSKPRSRTGSGGSRKN